MDVQAPLNPSTLFSARGLVAVITGGGSGIGLAIASALYQNNASKIYILGRRQNVLDDAIKTLEASPSAPKDSSGNGNGKNIITAIACDIASLESVKAAVAQIEKEVGYVDVLFNNAGILGTEHKEELHGAQSITQLRDAMLKGYDDWPSVYAINAQAVIGVSACFLPLLEAANVRRGWQSGRVGGADARKQDRSVLEGIGADEDDDRLAQIITIASVASYMRWCSATLAYNASKAAAAHLAKMMATFLAEWGVRSNVVCPGPYPSVMTQRNPKVFGTNQVPQGRAGNVNDVAGFALFLTAKSGAYLNGNVMGTDGGRMSVFPATY